MRQLISRFLLYFGGFALALYIILSNASGPVYGTGWFINEDGYFVTAGHIVGNRTTFSIMYLDRPVLAQLVAVDYYNDVAIFKTNLLHTPYIPLQLTFEDNSIVSVFGYPVVDVKGFNLKKADGSAINMFGDQIYLNAHICGGNSGGPIVSRQGGAIGILTNCYNKDKISCGDRDSGQGSKNIYRLALKYNIKVYLVQDWVQIKNLNNLYRQYINSGVIFIVYAS